MADAVAIARIRFEHFQNGKGSNGSRGNRGSRAIRSARSAFRGDSSVDKRTVQQQRKKSSWGVRLTAIHEAEDFQ